jgi:hypothetical protein
MLQANLKGLVFSKKIQGIYLLGAPWPMMVPERFSTMMAPIRQIVIQILVLII